MNARGERIIVFGDSLTHHGSDNAAEIWDVNAGSNRSSSAPGDLVASLLAEQGAAAVRVNARVSRSAWNFWNREPTNTLLASDRAFAPTKVVIILGTNDVGLNPTLDREAFAKLRDTYKAMGAEVWAVGPFSNTALPRAGVEQVVTTMKDVFGSRFIDGRPISVLIHPGGDGVHYPAASARPLALAITDALLSKFSPATLWTTIGLGAAGVLGAIAIAFAWKRHKTRGALLGEALGKLSRDDIDRMIAEGDESDLEVVQDQLLENGHRISEIAKVSGIVGPHTYANFELGLGGEKRFAWKVTQDGPRCIATFKATSGKDTGSAETKVNYYGAGQWCERSAAADAWAMIKTIKRVERSGAFEMGTKWPLNMSADLLASMQYAAQTDNSKPEELYGLAAHAGESGKGVSFHELIREDDPAAMDIAEDLVLERGWKLHEVTGGRGARNFTIDFGREHWYGTVKDGERTDNPEGRMVQASIHEPSGPTIVSQHRKETAAQKALKRAPADAFIIHEPETSVTNKRWLVARPRPNEIEMTVKFGGTRVKHKYESFATGDALRKQAIADAWAIAKTLKPLPITTPGGDVELIVENITKRDNVSKRSELYGVAGVNIVDGKRSRVSDAELVRSGARAIACKSGLDRNGLAKCWTLNGALGDAKQMLSAFETQLVGTPAGKALVKTLTPEQIADVRKVVTQAARNAEQLEAFEAEEVSELDGLGGDMSTKEIKAALAEIRAYGARAGIGVNVSKSRRGVPPSITLVQHPDKPPMDRTYRVVSLEDALAIARAGGLGRKPTSKDVTRAIIENAPIGGLGAYRVWYGTSSAGKTVAVDDGRSIPTIEAATKLMRAYKRQGLWTWVEDEQGNFVPVPGAKSEKVRKGYPKPALKGLGNQDDAIAYVVEDAAKRAKSWAPSSHKVFVSDVFEQIRADGRDDGMTLDEFKHELVRLHKAGKLRLARADLVAAMPHKKVAASEIDANGATFHFVER